MGGQITLSLIRQEGHAVIAVRDTGVGIAPEMLEGIFDLFTQVDRSLSASAAASALGSCRRPD
jgi:signal transduction histidine kinase